MDFFNKIGKKASETYQATKEKAVNISEEFKIKGKINNLKERKHTIYTEIGEIVFNDIKDGKDVAREDITPKCDEISKINDEISKLEVELLSYKKIKVCANCGRELEIEDKFCPACGKEQPKVEKVEIKEEPKETKEAEVIEVKDVPNNNEVKTEESNTENNSTENNNTENNNIENNNTENDNTQNNNF